MGYQRISGIVLALMVCGSASAATSITNRLEGAWSGSGRIVLAKGETEHIRCHGEGRAVSANTIEQHFKCATTAKNLNFSTSLFFSQENVTGTWTAPDGDGTLAGKASSTSIQLTLKSAVGQGHLSATISSCHQSLRVSGWSDEFKSLSVELRKPC
jgi:hypothetical protein